MILNLKEDLYTALVSKENQEDIEEFDNPNDILPYLEKNISPEQKAMGDKIINMILGGT